MNSDTAPHNQTEPTGASSRRTFLIAGGALVAGATLLRGDLLTGNGGLATFAEAAGPRIGVGYVEGSDGAASLEAALAGARRVVPAATLSAGGIDNQVASFTVHGFTPGTSADATCPFDNVFVDAHIASPDRLAT